MRYILMTTAAAAALMSSAAMADPGGNGKNKGGGNAKAHVQANAGSKNANVKAQAQVRPMKAQPQQRNFASNDKGPQKANKQAGNGNKPDHKPVKQSNNSHKPEKVVSKKDNGPKKMDNRKVDNRVVEKSNVHINNHDKIDNSRVVNNTTTNQRITINGRPLRSDLRRVEYTGVKGRHFYVPTNDRVRVITERRNWNYANFNRNRYYDGCPPGLAKKYNGCMPPGLAKQRVSYRWQQPNWYFNDWDRNYNYRYYDGYMLRMNSSNSILGYIPLLGGALALGQVWPSAYSPVSLPSYYSDYYGLGPVNSYRYYGNTIYRVNPETAAIQSIAALLTGNDFTVGQTLPLGYDVYNVPYGYRDQYIDGPDAWYRYSDGYVYQIDPTTRLVQAAIELLV